MIAALSARLAAIVEALPLRPGMRVLEIGGAPGAAARAVALTPTGRLLIDSGEPLREVVLPGRTDR
ncbi:hypothetical protein [Agromyces aerolatus]|uniref:hypothetical protein n=1 Tax=Agromyces sp. LY-1074 TaxID=3074080 RepID=UPI00286325CA|nr:MULTISPECIES: hypothetical protein [unclassified Agromyces]MDR5701848.1 hypothetical protein [Agromyces sp. LY-1074]MDR5708079.1 hypothetical protein [Agromyces sp. LY-1358]